MQSNSVLAGCHECHVGGAKRSGMFTRVLCCPTALSLKTTLRLGVRVSAPARTPSGPEVVAAQRLVPGAAVCPPAKTPPLECSNVGEGPPWGAGPRPPSSTSTWLSTRMGLCCLRPAVPSFPRLLMAAWRERGRGRLGGAGWRGGPTFRKRRGLGERGVPALAAESPL